MLANLPVDVAIGKMLIMGTLFNQIDAVLSLAAALSVQSPFTNNAYKDQDCVAARRQLDSDHGDPITLLNSFREWLEVKATNRETSKKWCKKRGLEEQVLTPIYIYLLNTYRVFRNKVIYFEGLLQYLCVDFDTDYYPD